MRQISVSSNCLYASWGMNFRARKYRLDKSQIRCGDEIGLKHSREVDLQECCVVVGGRALAIGWPVKAFPRDQRLEGIERVLLCRFQMSKMLCGKGWQAGIGSVEGLPGGYLRCRIGRDFGHGCCHICGFWVMVVKGQED